MIDQNLRVKLTVMNSSLHSGAKVRLFRGNYDGVGENFTYIKPHALAFGACFIKNKCHGSIIVDNKDIKRVVRL